MTLGREAELESDGVIESESEWVLVALMRPAEIVSDVVMLSDRDCV